MNVTDYTLAVQPLHKISVLVSRVLQLLYKCSISMRNFAIMIQDVVNSIGHVCHFQDSSVVHWTKVLKNVLKGGTVNDHILFTVDNHKILIYYIDGCGFWKNFASRNIGNTFFQLYFPNYRLYHDTNLANIIGLCTILGAIFSLFACFCTFLGAAYLLYPPSMLDS